MSRVHRFVYNNEVRYSFDCPGCGYGHAFRTEGPSPRWSFNGDVNCPTFEPSLLYIANGSIKRCHSFVREGMIQFLDDCDHELKGKTVALKDDP